MYQIIIRKTEEYSSNVSGSPTAAVREVTFLEARVPNLARAVKLIGELEEPAK